LLFGNAEDHGWTRTTNSRERDRLLIRNSWSPQTTYYVSTKNAFVFITGQRAALGTILAHGLDCQITGGALSPCGPAGPTGPSQPQSMIATTINRKLAPAFIYPLLHPINIPLSFKSPHGQASAGSKGPVCDVANLTS
jgi:hypothetical protein